MDGQSHSSPSAESFEGSSGAPAPEVSEPNVEAPQTEESLRPDLSVMDRKRPNSDQDVSSLRQRLGKDFNDARNYYKDEFLPSIQGPTEAQNDSMSYLYLQNLFTHGKITVPLSRESQIRSGLIPFAEKEKQRIEQIATFTRDEKGKSVEITLVHPQSGEEYKKLNQESYLSAREKKKAA
jgi:hypothetical protein